MAALGTIITLICSRNGLHAVSTLTALVLLIESAWEGNRYDDILECLRLLGDRMEDEVLEEMPNFFVEWLVPGWLSIADHGPFNLEHLQDLLRGSGQNVRQYVKTCGLTIPQALGLEIYQPTIQYQESLELAIACGWDPNNQPDGSWPLGMALEVLSKQQVAPARQEWLSPSWGTVALLI